MAFFCSLNVFFFRFSSEERGTRGGRGDWGGGWRWEPFQYLGGVMFGSVSPPHTHTSLTLCIVNMASARLCFWPCCCLPVCFVLTSSGLTGPRPGPQTDIHMCLYGPWDVICAWSGLSHWPRRSPACWAKSKRWFHWYLITVLYKWFVLAAGFVTIFSLPSSFSFLFLFSSSTVLPLSLSHPLSLSPSLLCVPLFHSHSVFLFILVLAVSVTALSQAQSCVRGDYGHQASGGAARWGQSPRASVCFLALSRRSAMLEFLLLLLAAAATAAAAEAESARDAIGSPKGGGGNIR